MSKQYPGGLITKTPVTPSGPYETSTASGIWTLDQQAYWRKLNQWPIAGSVQPDPQFNYVTMLLHGDGTNGAQNNTFLDSGPNTLSITRNGNTTQGSFSPYGSNWSNYFDGTGDYLSLPSSSAFTLGTGDFTIEMWYNPSVSYASGSVYLFDMGTNGCRIQLFNNTVYFDPGAGNYIQTSTGVGMTVGSWFHVAAVRSGSTMTLYVNGSSVGTTTNSSNLTNTLFRIGDYGGGGYGFNGYISNVRVVKGTAVYTTAFTPSTTPLTAITNTSLLTCQSNRFIDNSTNAFAITVNGTPSVQRFNPFGASTAYSTSVIGGSGYFDGTGDYLTAPDDAGFSLGSNNFTIESWVYPTASPAQPMIIGQWTSSYAWTMQLSNDSNRYLRALLHDGSFNDYVSSTSLQLNAWNHCAFVRESNTVSLYLNGARVYTTTFSGTVTNSTSAVSVGADASGGQPLQGYITNSRVVNGTALYSGTTYTVPTAPLSAVTNTKLLLDMTNGAIFDNAMMNDLETVGNAQISTSVVKYGTGSIAFDGTGDYLSGPSTPTIAFGSGAYTVEFWLYKDSTGSGERGIFQTQTASLYGLSIFADGTTIYIDERTNSFNGSDPRISGTISQDTWIHVAVCRQTGTSGTLRAFVNGTQIGSSVTANLRNLTSTGPIIVGNTAIASNPLKGYIDDLRITNGYARYTATFTPPTAAFPDIGPT